MLVAASSDLVRRVFYACSGLFSFPLIRGGGPPYGKYESSELDDEVDEDDRNV